MVYTSVIVYISLAFPTEARIGGKSHIDKYVPTIRPLYNQEIQLFLTACIHCFHYLCTDKCMIAYTFSISLYFSQRKMDLALENIYMFPFVSKTIRYSPCLSCMHGSISCWIRFAWAGSGMVSIGFCDIALVLQHVSHSYHKLPYTCDLCMWEMG